MPRTGHPCNNLRRLAYVSNRRSLPPLGNRATDGAGNKSEEGSKPFAVVEDEGTFLPSHSKLAADLAVIRLFGCENANVLVASFVARCGKE